MIVLIIPSIILYKLWWIPHKIQALMESQGIRGPSYKFLHGNTKEIIKIKQQTSDAAMEVSDHDIFQRIQPHLYSWINLYGSNFIQWIGTQPEVVVTEPELIKEILSNKEGNFPKITVEGYLKKLFGDGLVTTEGEKWFRQRKLANHTFHGDPLKVNMILYEMMRLYSPAILITRRISKRLKLGKYEFPTGVTVAIPALAVHRNVEIWGEDARMFKSERFEKGLAKATNGNSIIFLGFGFEPRTCVGLNFTINEGKIALAMILQRYEFTLSRGYVHSPYILLTNQPQ